MRIAGEWLPVERETVVEQSTRRRVIDDDTY
jgi:hypothetical protein